MAAVIGNNNTRTGATSSGAKLPSQVDKDRMEIKRLRSTHPLYEEYKPKWDFYLAAHRGGKTFAKENIFKHKREHKDDFDDRKERAHYLNYCKPITEFFTDSIYKETIQRDGKANDTFYKKFLQNVNKKGEDVTHFMKDVSEEDQIFGMVFGLVDAPPRPEGQEVSKADEERLGLRPYWMLVRPTEILDWDVDEFDNFRYAKRAQTMTIRLGGARHTIERYTEYEPATIKVTDIDTTEGEGKETVTYHPVINNSIGEVPLVSIRYERDRENRFMGVSFLVDIADNNKQVLNLTSLIDEFAYKQCFAQLAMESDGNVSFQDQNQGDIGLSNLLLFPREATHVPQFIAPPVDPAKFLQDERQRVTEEIYKRAAQDTINELFNGGKASGYSKAMSFSTTVPKIASRADTLERAEHAMMRLTMKYMGKEWDGTIKYKDHYEVTNLSDALSQLTSIFKDLQLKSQTFLKAQLKRIVQETDGKLTADELKTVYAEIDKMDVDEYWDTMKDALIGRAKEAADMETSADGAVPDAKQKPKPGAPKPQARKKPSSQAELRAESTKQRSANSRKQ